MDRANEGTAAAADHAITNFATHGIGVLLMWAG
jgi:hypothetical protein